MDNQRDHSAPRRLTRRADDRIVAGVAGGLGDYTGLDPVFFRIAFIILAIAGGSGIFLYLLGWLFVPEENQEEAIGMHLIERLRGKRWLAIAMVAIAGLLLIDWVQMGGIEWNFLLAAALIGIGFVLLRDEPAREQPSTAQPPAAGTPALPALAASQPPRRRRPRSPLGLLTVGAACVVVAIAVLLSMGGAIELDLGQFLALGITVLGAGLICGAWWGRAWLVAALATLLVPVMVLASMIDVPLEGSIASDYFSPRRNIDADYRLLAGTMTLDLSRYRFGDEPTEVDLSFVAGDVKVYVPEGVIVTTTGRMDLGVADLFGESSKGRNLDLDGTFERDGTTEGELILNVDGGLGSMDTTWATWVDQEKRLQRRRERRQERKDEAKEVEGRGRAADRKRDRR